MFGFLPHQFFVHHEGQNTSGLSPRLWRRVSQALMDGAGQTRLILTGDDFMCAKSHDTSTVLNSECSYTSYIDTGNTLTNLADERGGVLALGGMDADNDECWLASGDATSVLGAISDTAGADFITAFECRIKKGNIANDVSAIFCGLAEEGLAAAETKADGTGVFAAKDCIGFDNVHADGDAINFIYQKAGQTLVTKIAAVHVPVADTFVKLGFLYDPFAPAAKRIKVFVNNVEQTTYVTAANIATATFPDGEELGFLFGQKKGAATEAEVAIDWWAFAQVIRE